MKGKKTKISILYTIFTKKEREIRGVRTLKNSKEWAILEGGVGSTACPN